MNAFDQLSAMRGPHTTIILINAQWGNNPTEWTVTYENNAPATQVKLTVHGPDPEATILAMYERLMAVSKGIPQIAPLGIEHRPQEYEEHYMTSNTGDDEMPL